MSNSFVIDRATKEIWRGKTLLLDTNVLIDAFRLPEEFYDFTSGLIENQCDIVTTKSIAIEFLGGTSEHALLAKKKSFLESTFNKELNNLYLPLDRMPPDINDIMAFSRQANKFSIVDYELFCTLKKYGTNIALLTRNHKDFSTTLTKRIGFVTLLGDKEIHTYGVYMLG